MNPRGIVGLVRAKYEMLEEAVMFDAYMKDHGIDFNKRPSVLEQAMNAWRDTYVGAHNNVVGGHDEYAYSLANTKMRDKIDENVSMVEHYLSKRSEQ